MEIHLIWAQDFDGGIGKQGQLPWHISEDLKNFADGHRDSNYRPSQRHQEMYAVSGCDEALELSCRIKPNKKSLFN